MQTRSLLTVAALTIVLPLTLAAAGTRAAAGSRTAVPPEHSGERRTVEFHGRTMGATFSVKVVADRGGLDSARHAELDRAIRLQLARINGLMSTWDPDSELSRFNRSASLDPFPVSPETFDVLRWALDLAALTGGALDVTVAPLVAAWGFGPDGARAAPPSPDEIARLREATGAGSIELDAAAGTVRRTRPGVRVDLSALAPGYAVDRLWTELTRRGLTDFLVDVGGELRTRGCNDAGEPWQIAIERPLAGERAIQHLVSISDLAIATSGDYQRYREVDGRRVTHIVDPRTGWPIDHRLASVTVIDALAVRADALATALLVLGTEAGMALSESQKLAALFIERTDGGFAEQPTSRFEALTSTRTRACATDTSRTGSRARATAAWRQPAGHDIMLLSGTGTHRNRTP
jgi:FAD:protein FMN transferase